MSLIYYCKTLTGFLPFSFTNMNRKWKFVLKLNRGMSINVLGIALSFHWYCWNLIKTLTILSSVEEMLPQVTAEDALLEDPALLESPPRGALQNEGAQECDQLAMLTQHWEKRTENKCFILCFLILYDQSNFWVAIHKKIYK